MLPRHAPAAGAVATLPAHRGYAFVPCGEFQLTDAIQSLLGQEQVLAYRYQGTRYDCGSKPGYLKATVEYALKHPETGANSKKTANSASDRKRWLFRPS